MAETAELRHWTYADYARLPDDGKRYEIIRGEKLVCPSPSWKHQRAYIALAHALESFSKRQDAGKCVCAPIDVVLADDVVVQPDVLFISTARLGIVTGKTVAGTPDFVVEILSDATRRHDHVVKRRLYTEHGVREYWIVDRDIERVEPLALEGVELVHKGVVASGEVRSLVALPGFAVSLADLFA